MGSRAKKERLKKGRLFVPLIFSFGAALEDLAIDEFLRDPTKISNTLRTMQSYFQVDGVASYADTTLLAEALGCQVSTTSYPPTVHPWQEWPDDMEERVARISKAPRVATALEVTKRLNILLPESILVGIVTGPLTLCSQLTGTPVSRILEQPERVAAAGKASLTLAKAIGDAGIDILIVREIEVPLQSKESGKVISRSYAPIWNTAKFYDISPLMMVENFLPEDAGQLGRAVEGLLYPAKALENLAKKPRRLSLALPVTLLEKDPTEIELFLTQGEVAATLQSAKVLLVTTDAEVPETVNKEHMIRGVQTIRDVLGRNIST